MWVASAAMGLFNAWAWLGVVRSLAARDHLQTRARFVPIADPTMHQLITGLQPGWLELMSIDPHPDDFVEDGLEALRIIRGINSPNIGMVYVACHTFHMGGTMGGGMTEIMRAAGDKLRLVHVADTMDHHRSHGLRYITNPPGNPARVHQHLKIGDGDVDWDEFFGGLAEIGFYDRPDTVMVSSVFAEDENADEVSRYQLATMSDYISKYGR